MREAGYSRIVAPIFAHPTTFPAAIRLAIFATVALLMQEVVRGHGGKLMWVNFPALEKPIVFMTPP